MTELEYHYFAIPNKMMSQTNDYQWLLKSLAEKWMENIIMDGLFRLMTYKHICQH